MFLQKTDIIATIKGFGLDVNKFWWAVLFVYDWSIEKFTKCFWVKLPPKSLTKILDYIGDSKDFEITFRVKGKKSREADPNVKAAVMYGLRQKLKEWKDKEFYRIIDRSTHTTSFTNSSYYTKNKMERKAFAPFPSHNIHNLDVVIVSPCHSPIIDIFFFIIESHAT